MRPVSLHFAVVGSTPGHVRVAVFVGRQPGDRANAGELTFRVDEWAEVRARLVSLEDVEVSTDADYVMDARD